MSNKEKISSPAMLQKMLQGIAIKKTTLEQSFINEVPIKPNRLRRIPVMLHSSKGKMALKLNSKLSISKIHGISVVVYSADIVQGSNICQGISCCYYQIGNFALFQGSCFIEDTQQLCSMYGQCL